MVLVPLNVIRYKKDRDENVGAAEGVGADRIVICAVTYFLWLSAYAACFWKATWQSEVAFDLFSVIVWGAVCLLCRRRRIVAHLWRSAERPVALECAGRPIKTCKIAEEAAPAQSAEEAAVSRADYIASALQQCMETDRLYLNPLLSLNDLAMAAGTNKTYISSFINRGGKTFYDYVNEYRISEACRIIDSTDERLSMADVASRSGFNSMSTFNRYFLKLKGVTPARYSRRRS